MSHKSMYALNSNNLKYQKKFSLNGINNTTNTIEDIGTSKMIMGEPI